MPNPRSVFEGMAGRRAVGLESKATANVNSEHGIGALMPWADKLYIQTYLSATNTDTANGDTGQNGAGSGLFSMDKQRRIKLERYDGSCSPGRMIHRESQQLFIGPNVVSKSGVVTPIPGFQPGGSAQGARIAAWCRGRTNAANVIHAWTMGGILYTVDVNTLAILDGNADAVTALGITASTIHGKSAWKMPQNGGEIWVSFNNDDGQGRLAKYSGTAWTIIDSQAYINIAGSYGDSNYAFATGHDNKSVLLQVLDPAGATPRKFRLPFGGDSWQMYFQQEWMRCRQAESERFLLDAYGLWYDLSPFLWGSPFSSAVPRIRAIGAHTRIVPDFCMFDGSLVLGGNHQSAIYSNYVDSGQSSGGLLMLDSTDELRRIPPAGYGYFVLKDTISAGWESLPMLAAGFGQATFAFRNGNASTATTITIYGWIRDQKVKVGTVSVPAGADGAVFIPPADFRCDWWSVSSSVNVTELTARVDYAA